MAFDLGKYRRDREDRWNRLATAGRFTEPDRVPVVFSIGGSYYCWLFGYDIGEYYANPELQVEVQLKGLEWEYTELKADSCTRDSIGYESGPVQEAVVFGAPVERPAGTSPRIVHMWKNLDEAIKADFPAPAENPRLAAEIEKAERFKRAAKRAGVTVPVHVNRGIGIHPPLSCLCALMPPETVLEAMHEEPEKLKRALDRCFAAYLAYDGVPGPRDSFWLADDNISMISASDFREFEMPYYLKLKDRYGAKHVHLHTDGPNDQHFTVIANESGVTNMDIGGFSRLDNAVREMKGKVFLHGGLNCKDLYGRGPLTEEAREKALAAIRLAAPGGGFELAIGGETYAGVSPRALADLVKLVEEKGRYPIG